MTKSGWLAEQVEQAKIQVDNLSEWKQQAIRHEVQSTGFVNTKSNAGRDGEDKGSEIRSAKKTA